MYPKKINQLRNILDTVQLTLTQVYESEFDTKNSSNSFGNVLNKIIARKLGSTESDDKKVPFIHHILSPRGGINTLSHYPPRGDKVFIPVSRGCG